VFHALPKTGGTGVPFGLTVPSNLLAIADEVIK
jgi:hypothetical protein